MLFPQSKAAAWTSWLEGIPESQGKGQEEDQEAQGKLKWSAGAPLGPPVLPHGPFPSSLQLRRTSLRKKTSQAAVILVIFATYYHCIMFQDRLRGAKGPRLRTALSDLRLERREPVGEFPGRCCLSSFSCKASLSFSSLSCSKSGWSS